tara:strand:+ start:463 stop:585 length:123 start_codon:yes stop_codon:yes gene_type:complete
MSKNSSTQTINTFQEWRNWMVKKGAIKTKKKTQPLYNFGK